MLRGLFLNTLYSLFCFLSFKFLSESYCSSDTQYIIGCTESAVLMIRSDRIRVPAQFFIIKPEARHAEVHVGSPVHTGRNRSAVWLLPLFALVAELAKDFFSLGHSFARGCLHDLCPVLPARICICTFGSAGLPKLLLHFYLYFVRV